MRDSRKEYLPHGVTENEFWERLDPLQLEWTGTKESLPDGADSRFHKAALWILLPKEKWNKKTAKKYISWIVIKLWPATNENRRYKSGAA